VKTLVDWFARNPVAANLLMLVLVVGGVVGATTAKMELFPEFSLDMVSVSVVYPGASPEEVEEGICIKIEEEVHGIEGVERVTSTAVEGMGTVMIEVRSGEDARRVLDDVKTRVDAISTFPDEGEKPVIQEILMRQQVINVAVFGDAGERRLKELGERVRDEINALPGVSQVELVSARPYEMSIEVSEAALQRHGLTFDDVARAVRASSLDLSGGTIKTERGEILLRTKGQAYRGAQFEELTLLAREDGTRVTVGDVATVVDGFEDTDQASRFDGEPAVLVQVFRVGDESALGISAAVRDYVDALRPTLPEGIDVRSWQDTSVWLQGRLDLLVKNGLQGLFLVFLVLALFLKLRLSFWVTMGIPISFLGTLAVMPSLGQSINMLSLFAFILVLGIVVDDAIVVGENIETEQKGGPSVEASVRGVRGVTIPVVFAVLTTVAAFLPIAFLPGVIGKFFSVVPLVVIPALVFSLVESQLVLPAHLSHGWGFADRLGRHWPFKGWTLIQTGVARALDAFVRRVYRPTLETALRWRYATVALAIATMLITLGAVAGGMVKFVFFPEIEGDVVTAQVTMPQGTAAAQTAAAVAQLERSAEAVIAELEGPGREGRVFRSFMASIGEQPYLAQQRRTQGGGSIVGSQYGELVIELLPSEERDRDATDVVARWRELCGPIPGAVELNFSSAVMSAGDPVDVQLSGNQVSELKAAALELEAALARYEGVFDVSDSFRGGKQELVLDVLPGAEALGVSRADLARQVRRGFYGEEAQRVQRGRDEMKVMVRYPEETREGLHGLDAMHVRSPRGGEVPFSSVASVRPQRGYATIERTDRRRTIHVTADVDLTAANPNEVVASLEADVLPGILAAHPGVEASFEGQSSDQREFAGAMLRYFLISLFAIYALMAVPFRSYLQPAIVMTAIPFGIVGAVWGHAILGYDLSTLSVLGIAALAGVVVNDSLVLVDYVNRERERGLSVQEAARSAGLARFRPILLTSLTTFVGLAPLIAERSVQAQFLIPMAVSLAFGVIFSTVISLILVPSAYLILEDLARAWRWLYGSGAAASAAPLPLAEAGD